MVRKKGPSRPPDAQRGTVSIRLDLTDGHRDQLRVLAAMVGMSMAEYARAVVVERIVKEAGVMA